MLYRKSRKCYREREREEYVIEKDKREDNVMQNETKMLYRKRNRRI